MANFGWDYPPGVTGNEPAISGIYPIWDVLDGTLEELKKAQDILDDAFAYLDDQGHVNTKIELAFDDIVDRMDQLRDHLGDLYPEEPNV